MLMLRTPRFGLAALVVVGLVTTVPGSPAFAQSRPLAGRPTPGAASAGDRLFPGLGNGGYGVQRYDIAFDYDAGPQTVAAKVGIVARPTHPLSRFDLDFEGNAISQLRVDGVPASYRRDGQKLVITPAHALRRAFRVDV